MPATVTPNNVDRQLEAMGDGYAFKGNIALSGSYSTGGDTLDFGPIFQTIGVGTIDYVDIEDKAGFAVDYDYTNKKVVVRQDAAAGNPSAELPAAAYPAALTTGTLRCLVRGR
jgi:hypothetical protein